MAKTKYVYAFGGGAAEGDGGMKELLGGKGAGLAEMTKIGLPVPAGFTITTEVCDLYYKAGRKWPAGLDEEVAKQLKGLEKNVGKKLGDPKDPLLVSVRSGAAISMPGMMETILNLGLTDVSVEGLATKTGNRRFALDAYRRFIMMYGSTAMGIEREEFDKIFGEVKESKTRKRLGVPNGSKVSDTDVNEAELVDVIAGFKALYKRHIKKDFPQDPQEQLRGSIDAVFNSWMADKAVTFRKVEKIQGVKGTAVSIVQMVFGNKGDTSGTGVCFTRDPNNGVDEFYGDYLINAQGEDVVAGIRTPIKLSEFERKDPKAYKQLLDVRSRLEKHYKDMQDLEFTVEEGKLYMLQCRTGKRSPFAAFKIAVDMVNEKLITKEDAIMRIKTNDIEGIFYPMIDKSQPQKLKDAYLVQGIDAVPGAACGKVVFNAKVAEDWAAKGEKVILVRKETSPEDVGGMHAAQGILTATGGKTSHAAVVARGMGKTAVCGADGIEVDPVARTVRARSATGAEPVVLGEGDVISIDGSTGEVFAGAVPVVPSPVARYLEEGLVAAVQGLAGEAVELVVAVDRLLRHADSVRRLSVRANADTAEDAARARSLGAQGIGLCRTEHMFLGERRVLIERVILAGTPAEREAALADLLPLQRQDVIELLEAMDGLPTTIRLLDPPLHEFLPDRAELMVRVARAEERGEPHDDDLTLLAAVERLHESNPMLGLRGVRLGLVVPGLFALQVRAIAEAAVERLRAGGRPKVEIMVPLVGSVMELYLIRDECDGIITEVAAAAGLDLTIPIGTMVELPRAALTAFRIAEAAEFFSFGTNDLTQTTWGFSRDDVEAAFFAAYLDKGVFTVSPFESLDVDGVGRLVRLAVKEGRRTRPDLKLGVCGEHGGDPESIHFFHSVGLDYVSCSPFRIPVARLEAGRATVLRGAVRGATAEDDVFD